MTRAKAADHFREAFLQEEFVAEYPVAQVARVIEFSVMVIQSIDPNVMKQTAGSYQVRIEVKASAVEKLFCDSAYDLTVAVNKIERFLRGRMSRVQPANLSVCRNLHAGSLATCEHKCSISKMNSVYAGVPQPGGAAFGSPSRILRSRVSAPWPAKGKA